MTVYQELLSWIRMFLGEFVFMARQCLSKKLDVAQALVDISGEKHNLTNRTLKVLYALQVVDPVT